MARVMWQGEAGGMSRDKAGNEEGRDATQLLQLLLAWIYITCNQCATTV